jgi:predicted transcriptional regulator
MEIHIDILKAVASGKNKPTHIMYRANLCWTRLKKHLDFLMKCDLIQKIRNKDDSIFMLSEKGRNTLQYYKIRFEEKNILLPNEVYIKK